MLRSALAALTLAAITLTLRPAEACSPPPPGFHAVAPESGAMIPANTVIALVGYNVIAEPDITISTFDAIYSISAMNVEGVFLVPIEPLGLTGPISLFATTNEPGGTTVSADYIVEPERDEVPPVFGEIEEFRYEWWEDEPGLCMTAGFSIQALVTPATDGHGVSRYHLYEVMPNDAVRHAGYTLNQGQSSISIWTHGGTEDGTRCYAAVAVDIAGNRTPEIIRAAIRCVDLQRNPSPDAGVPDIGFMDAASPDTGAPDGGTKPDTGTTVADSGVTKNNNNGSLDLDTEDGCGCSSHRGSAPGGALIFLLGALCLIRRAR